MAMCQKDKKTHEATVQILDDAKAKIENLKMRIAKIQKEQSRDDYERDGGAFYAPSSPLSSVTHFVL